MIIKSPKSKRFKPKTIEDAKIVADCLRDKLPLIVNFEETEPAEFKRIMDFISGTIYAIDGNIKTVSQKVFICAPSNIEVSSPEDAKKSW